ncbi:MAG: LacI family DNA-binding transcriptional regulator [Acidimicrobiia bacterium]
MSRPTIHDVAERAGVSKSLVSLVLQGSSSVAESKRQAVHNAIAELGYRPNWVARSLVAKRTHAIGVMVSDLRNPFFPEIVEGIEEAAREAGYRIVIASGNRSPTREEEALETLLQMRTDGMILAGPILPMEAVIESSRDTPVVLLTRPSPGPSVDSVTNDERIGAALAVRHLYELGHQRIAHIHAGQAAGAPGRQNGYESAMESLGLAGEIRLSEGAYTEEGGFRGARRLLRSASPPTAIFAPNDLAAIGALNAIEEEGLRVPDHVSLVGYDNTYLAALRHIALTTIDQPRFEMGQRAVQLLGERIEDKREDTRRVVLPPSLVIRQTTGPPPP